MCVGIVGDVIFISVGNYSTGTIPSCAVNIIPSIPSHRLHSHGSYGIGRNRSPCACRTASCGSEFLYSGTKISLRENVHLPIGDYTYPVTTINGWRCRILPAFSVKVESLSEVINWITAKNVNIITDLTDCTAIEFLGARGHHIPSDVVCASGCAKWRHLISVWFGVEHDFFQMCVLGDSDEGKN